MKMKKVKGIITMTSEGRFVDRVAEMAHKMKLFEDHGYYPIIHEKTGKEMGRLMCIVGPRPVVRFLEIITEIRGKDTKEVNVEF